MVSMEVGGLLPINGVIYKKRSTQPKWYLLCVVNNQLSIGIHLIVSSFMNVASTHISFDIVAFNAISLRIKAKFHLRANDQTYEPLFKYKKDGTTIKLWCKAGDILALFSRTPSTVLVEQEPDDDAIDITGDI